MKSPVKRLPLALTFALLGLVCVRLNPDGLGTIDQIALFSFGVLAGVNLGLYWGDRRSTATSDLAESAPNDAMP